MRIEIATGPLKSPTRRLIVATTLISAIGLVSALILVWKFPFRRAAVISRIENGAGIRVETGTFHHQWFPPGFTAGHVRLSNRNGDVLTITAFALRGSYIGLLRSPRAVSEIRASGLHLTIAAPRQTLLQSAGANAGVAVGEIRLEDTRLDLLSRTPGTPPLTFLIRTLRLEHVGQEKPAGFNVFLHNPRPDGEIRAHGEFGPLNRSDPASTPLSGVFTFEKADLTVKRAITGILNASGRFQGHLSRIECAGTADVPHFRVFGSGHAVHIASRFEATVNAGTGDASLRQIVAHFNSTTVSASGNVTDTADRPGKTVLLNVAIHEGRVDDLLLLFTRHSTPAMSGPVSLTGKFTIPPARRVF